MLNLRSDFKLGVGLAVAGVGVLGIYLILSSLTGTSKVSAQDPLAIGASPNQPGQAGVSLDKGTSSPLIINAPTGAAGAVGAVVLSANNAARPEVVVSSSTSNDPWEKAFNTGKIEPVITQTPDPRAARTASTSADSALIRGINASTGIDSAAPGGQASRDGSTASGVAPQNSTIPATGSLNSSPERPQLSPSLTPQQASAQQIHVVESGETLTSIASQYYRNGNKFKLILDANPGLNPNRLKLGAKLIIPAANETVINDAPAIDPMTPVTLDATKHYRVEVGDSLHKIAYKLYGSTSEWVRLYELNKQLIGTDPARVKVGSVLQLPEPPTQSVTAQR